MDREIKFRAWDKNAEKMVYQDKLKDGSKDEYWFLLNTQGISLMHFDEHYNAYVDTDAEIMEYTGAKDANGVEIYESDIVKMIDYRHKGVVKYINGAFIIDWNDEHLNGSLYFWNNNQSSIEVIGNIFENKELLEVENE